MERDRFGEPFEDDFTEEREPSPVEREEEAHSEREDPDVDSQADDETMKDNVFGVDNPQPKKKA